MSEQDRSLRTTTTSAEIEPHVFEGELVEDASGISASRLWRQFVNRWQRSSRVPAALKSRQAAKQAVQDATAFALRAPWRFTTTAGRGLLAAVRGWRRWVRVHDYREAAEHSEKLADKFTEIRALTLFRWKVTVAVTITAAVLVAVADLVYGSAALWITGSCCAVALAFLGRRKDGSPGRKPSLSGPRTLAWTMDPQLLVDAFRDAKLIGKDESLRLVERAAHDGAGWAVTVDLPATRKAADAIKNREALASALAVDEMQLIVERVRGRGGHAGRVFLWIADEDPYSGPPVRFPLLDAKRWDAWRPIPFGQDARNRRIDLQLVWTSLVVGAIPRQGKTFAARLPAAGLILDPYTRLYVFDGKGGKDWEAAGAVAHRFVCGDELEHVETVRDRLVELVAEVQSRFTKMSALDDAVCPESKITPGISRDPELGMPITAVIIDEVQVYLENTTRQDVGGKKTTLGAYITDLLAYLARKGPAVGIVVVLATQRPDSNTIPPRLRAVLGSRFALRVMDWRDSNIVLGEQMNTRGYDASGLLPRHKGVGILRPDSESDTGSEFLAVTVQTYYMDNAEWRSICTRGRALRETAGTLSGHAAGDDSLQTVDQSSVVQALGSDTGATGGWSGRESLELTEPLASVVNYLGGDLDPGVREFVPTAELTETLDAEPSTFAQRMGELGCRPVRHRVQNEDGDTRRVRGYLTAEIRAAVERAANDEISSPDDGDSDPS
ncbi:S-DNA-T family DNA segregation ATPase FtsK/SpoIIIE [Actinopolyspora biskrensis]|uniref:S-DNA-T family DNA segregation ATPase FtsK/SpoIIIE n=1 Tax=Actinopolyspora biskrensis TaxID=1470178 RepID=A0A852Z4M0_9ACTN|nr:FtsK/SpoIIIE domain-containing protein [Actinopolyspora biskrensis]NYH77203.1 S-DNA-T family DNA segregation ATPase FtsK/SpoIIIE [Actinopolyspora biskrensis]